MKPLTPLGTASSRFLAEPSLALDEPHAIAQEGEDSAPAYLGWEFARCADGLAADEQSALACLGAACVASMLAGSTRLPAEGPALAASLAVVGGAETIAVVERLLQRARSPGPGEPVAKVIGRPGERKPLILEDGWLYLERMRVLETRFCARIRDRMGLEVTVEVPDSRAIGRAIEAVATGVFRPTREQRRAIREGLRARLALITGGPGTGKTSTVVWIVRALAWVGTPVAAVAVAAPTGKAAQRLGDALSAAFASASGDIADEALRKLAPEPQTLHRLLGWSPSSGRFARHENDPLPQRVIIVDEASMIDLAMMDRLLRALRPDARLVLLGDAAQLPSVEAGAVFRDMCAALNCVRLSTNLRVAPDPSARTIITSAEAVNSGTFGEAVRTRHSVSELTFEGVEHLDGRWSEVAVALLDAWWQRLLVSDGDRARRASRTYRLRAGAFDDEHRTELARLFAQHAGSRLLCATRVQGYPACTDFVNRVLLNRLRGGERRLPLPWHQGHQLALGAPVLVTRNDYSRGLFNGDQGLVLRVEPEDSGGPRPMAVFRRGAGFDVFPLSADLAPAFAITVHKAQGSEFDHVALVLPDADRPLLTRELVYTAMTRARLSVLVVGEGDLLARIASRTAKRYSGVADKLRKT
jgi:exodeoxyribonuclease V alpha subunit